MTDGTARIVSVSLALALVVSACSAKRKDASSDAGSNASDASSITPSTPLGATIATPFDGSYWWRARNAGLECPSTGTMSIDGGTFSIPWRASGGAGQLLGSVAADGTIRGTWHLTPDPPDMKDVTVTGQVSVLDRNCHRGAITLQKGPDSCALDLKDLNEACASAGASGDVDAGVRAGGASRGDRRTKPVPPKQCLPSGAACTTAASCCSRSCKRAGAKSRRGACN
jgi:hypothetical protein